MDGFLVAIQRRHRKYPVNFSFQDAHLRIHTHVKIKSTNLQKEKSFVASCTKLIEMARVSVERDTTMKLRQWRSRSLTKQTILRLGITEANRTRRSINNCKAAARNNRASNYSSIERRNYSNRSTIAPFKITTSSTTSNNFSLWIPRPRRPIFYRLQRPPCRRTRDCPARRCFIVCVTE